MINRRSLLGAAGASLLAAPALGQAYPNKSLKMVVPYPPGGGTDGLGRITAERLSEKLGQQIIVQNIGGASSTVGSETVRRADPDGEPPQGSNRQRQPDGIDHGGVEAVLDAFGQELLDVDAGGVGAQVRVLDMGGHIHRRVWMHVCWNAAAPFKLNRHGEGISLKEFARIYIVSNPELISARKPVRVVNDMARRDKVAIGTTICIVNGDVESGTAGPRSSTSPRRRGGNRSP